MPPNETNGPDDSPKIPTTGVGVIKMADGIRDIMRAKRDEYRRRIESHLPDSKVINSSPEVRAAPVQEMLEIAEQKPDALAQRLRLVYKFILADELLHAQSEVGIHPDSEQVQGRISELCGDRPIDLHSFIYAIGVVGGRASGKGDDYFEFEDEIR